jgi:hypothetical protein
VAEPSQRADADDVVLVGEDEDEQAEGDDVARIETSRK